MDSCEDIFTVSMEFLAILYPCAIMGSPLIEEHNKMITETVRFFEDKDGGAEEFVTVIGTDECDWADNLEKAWDENDRRERFDGTD